MNEIRFRRRRLLILLVVAVGGLTACGRQPAPPKPGGSPPPPETKASGMQGAGTNRKSPLLDFAVEAVSTKEGEAIWYDVPGQSLPERRAWTGEMTAASDVLPLNTYARISRLEGGDPNKSIIVRVTDNGVQQKGTLVDVNREAAEALGMIKAGKVKVRLEVLALKNADADKPVQKKDAPAGPKLDAPAATKDDEKQAAKAKTGE